MITLSQRVRNVSFILFFFLFWMACPVASGMESHAVPTQTQAETLPAGVMEKGFIYEQASFPSCHASTVEETPSGLVAAWFGGTDEGNPDVCIWISRKSREGWSAPVQVADGIQNPEVRYPCWNPVLFQLPNGSLLLFYKVGPNPRQWWGMVKRSSDDGKTWSAAERLPNGILGPIKNKPVMIPSGVLVSPCSTEEDGWRAHVELSLDRGKAWKKVGLESDIKEFSIIQPTVLIHGPNLLQLLFRSRQGKIAESWSLDGALTWSSIRATELPNPNSGIDAVTLSDKRFLLVYNHVSRGRSPLNVALSKDGKQWQAAVRLESEPGEYSYPAVIQDSKGMVHITYTWKRKKIRYVVLRPDQVSLREIKNGIWPE
jgi:predicted neuraminidase